MIKRILSRFILAVSLLTATVVGVSAYQASPAGASIAPCPGGINGWFDTTNGAVNCTIDGNHVVVDVYSPGGTYVYHGVVDLWAGWNCDRVAVFTGSTQFGFQFLMYDGQGAYGCILGSEGVYPNFGPAVWTSNGAPYQYADLFSVQGAYQFKQAAMVISCAQNHVSDTDGITYARPRGTENWQGYNHARVQISTEGGYCGTQSAGLNQMLTRFTVTYQP